MARFRVLLSPHERRQIQKYRSALANFNRAKARLAERTPRDLEVLLHKEMLETIRPEMYGDVVSTLQDEALRFAPSDKFLGPRPNTLTELPTTKGEEKLIRTSGEPAEGEKHGRI